MDDGKTPLGLAVGVAFLFCFTQVVSAAQTCNSFIPSANNAFRYSDLGDSSFLDNQTGLIWQKCSIGQNWNSGTSQCDDSADEMTWSQALQSVVDFNQKQANLGAASDWYLPNIKELFSTTSLNCDNPALNELYFQPVYSPTAIYWSSTPHLSVTGSLAVNGSGQYTTTRFIWGMEIKHGSIGPYKADSTQHVRLVRNGMSLMP